VRALTEALDGIRPRRAGVRTPALARRMAETPPDGTVFETEPAALDPREVIATLDRIIPKDWDMVSGAGHSSAFVTHMRGRRPERFHAIREFSAIGNALSVAIGVAAARGDGRVILLDGDGGLLMHIQELETIAREGIRLIVCVLNDGGYGAEVHKLRAEGIDASAGVFGRSDFGAIANSFGLDGAVVFDLTRFEGLFGSYAAGNAAAVWDIHISDKVISTQMRRQTGAAANP
jgi:acetolactate synthase I/II/III large subunit